MNLGLYGGSFDPVHLGHLLVAQAAREEAGLDRVYFLPVAQSPFKPERRMAPAEARCRLLRLALAGCPWAELDDQEIRLGGVSYTVDTARVYRERFPQARLFYLIGADNVAALPQWREAGALAGLVEFLVGPRPGEAAPALPSPFRGRFLRGAPIDLSSSDLRTRIQARRPFTHLLPAGVGEAILNNGLYL